MFLRDEKEVIVRTCTFRHEASVQSVRECTLCPSQD